MRPKQKKNGLSETAIFCTKCGNKLLPDTVFCEQCGTRVPAPAVSEEYEAVAPIGVYDVPSKKKISKDTIILFAVLGILLVATIVAAIFIISGLGSAERDNGSTYNVGYSSSYQDQDNDGISQEEYSENTVMKVAIEAAFAPYSWSEGGDYYGLHVDIAKEIAKRTGKRISFVVVDFHDMISGVDSGLYDMAFGLEKTPEREEIVAFTDEYYDGMCAIYHTKDEKPSFSEWTEYTKTLQDIKDDGTLKTLLSKYNLS